MAEPPRHAPSTRPRGRFARSLVAATATLALLISAGSAFGLVKYVSVLSVGVQSCFYGKIVNGECHTPSAHPSSAPSVGPCANDVCNYLLLGSDSRAGLSPSQQHAFGNNGQAGAGYNSDVIMLVHTDPKLQKAIIVSFPRDLWVDIPGHGEGKINSSFGLGGGISGNGPQLVAATVHSLTGLTINHYLYVDLKGFEGVVKTLNGVDMCIAAENVDTPGYVETENADGSIGQVYYPERGHIVDPRTGLDVMPGCQRLDATQALAYVRTRHLRCDSAAPDFYRIGRQQQFFRAVLNRLLQPQELIQAPNLIGPILQSMRRDDKLDPADLAYLVGQLRGVSTGAVEFRSVPATGFTTPDGLDALHMDASANQIFNAIRQGKALGSIGVTPIYTPPSPANITVPLVDHASAGKAPGVETVLSQSGFDISPGVVTFDAYAAKASGNVIAYAPGHADEAKVVQQYLPRLQTQQIKGLPDDVAVFVTSSYTPAEVGTGGTTTPPDCLSPTG